MASATLPRLRAQTARARLAEATHDIHLRMHGLAPFAAIEQRRLDRPGYARLLTRLAAFHGAIHAAAADAGLAHLTGSTERLALLADDLSHLNAALAQAPEWRPITEAEHLGALYVAQGSTLGGKILYRRLDYLFEGAEGRSFFKGSPEDSRRWRTLLEAVEAHGSSPALHQGAIAAFHLFEQCLTA